MEQVWVAFHELRFEENRCVCHIAVTKYRTRSNLRGTGFILAYQFILTGKFSRMKGGSDPMVSVQCWHLLSVRP